MQIEVKLPSFFNQFFNLLIFSVGEESKRY